MAFESQTSSSVLEYPTYYDEVNFSERNDDEFLEYAYKYFSNADIENKIPILYLDSAEKRNVTVGVGHKIDNVNGIKRLENYFVYKKDPTKDASESDRVEEYNRIKKLSFELDKKTLNPSQQMALFESNTLLKIPIDPINKIKQLFSKDAIARIQELKKIFSRFNKFPDPAKLGILDVYFNVGGGASFSEFIKFKTAIFRQDWKTAKIESFRYGPSPRRINATYKLFEEANEVQKKTNIPANTLERTMQKQEVKDILQSEKGYDDVW